MKKLSKVLVLVLALVMTLSMASLSAFAAQTKEVPAKGTITITPPDNATGENTYQIYKVFEATVNGDAVAYKLLPDVADSNVPVGFEAKNGYVTKAPTDLDDTASALAAYDAKVLVDTVKTNGTTPATSKELDPGYYYIKTSTGTAVYVENGGNIQIKDKNVLSKVEKSAGTQYDADSKKAIAAVGTDQPFTAQITVGHGTSKLEFSDTMTGMEYNNDVVITFSNKKDGSAQTAKYTATPAADKKSFTVSFDTNDVKALEDGTVITLKYSAKITSDALTTEPAKNKAELKTDNDNTSSSEVEVYNATLTVKKTDGKDPLKGAGFTLYKKNAENEYVVEREEIKGADLTEFVFKGLGAGDYRIVESTVPAGYNKADDVDFSISDSDFTAGNLVIGKTVVNNAGTVLPGTGGIGTTIFYVLGTLLVVGCGIVLVSRRRMENNK